MKKMLALVFVFALFGLFALMLVASYSEPEQVPIILLQEHLDSQVRISGQVTRASHSNTTTFLKVQDKTAEVSVVAFGNCSQIKKGDNVRVKGRVQVYEKKVEIVADSIFLA
jgi:exonuclease VII large subunit